MRRLHLFALMIMLVVLGGSRAAAQSNVNGGIPIPLPIICISGCTGGGGSGGTSSTFGAAFPATGTAAGFIANDGTMAGGNLDPSGNLLVYFANTSMAVTQGTSPWVISGTVAATQSGTWTVTGAGGTFPVTGSFLTDTQLRATAVPVSLTSTTITGTVTVAGGKTNNNAAPGATNVGALGCLANAAAPTWTEGDLVLCSADLSGNQRVILTAGTAVIGHVITDSGSVTAATLSAETTKVIGVVRNADGSGNLLTSSSNALDVNLKTSSITLPVSLTSTTITGTVAVTQSTSPWIVAGGGTAGSAASGVVTIQGIASMTKLLVTPDANSAINVAQINGVTPLMGTGNTGTGSLRVTIASDQVAIPASQSGTWTVQPGNTPNTTAWLVSQVPTTTAGTATCYITSAASTNSTSCKGSAGNVYGIYIINTTTTNYFLRIYNSSSAPTCSSATGFIETVPALGAAANGGGISRMQESQAYSTGIGFCLTGGGSSTDNTNAATGVYVTILYK